MKGPAREDAVARLESVGHALSIPDHRALQPDTGAELGTRANHDVAIDACARALRVGDGGLLGELNRVEVGCEVLGGCTYGLPDEIFRRNDFASDVRGSRGEPRRDPAVEMAEDFALGE